MTWYLQKITLPGYLNEPFEERLLMEGVSGFSVERQPGEPRVEFSIFAKNPDSLPDSESLFRWLAAVDLDGEARIDPVAPEGDPDRFIISPVEILRDEDWDAGFRAHFARSRLTPRLEIIPSWERHELHIVPGRWIPGANSELQVVIEPGQAFGTGDHPTTAGCLRRLEERMGDPGSDRWSILDIGSGTGILGIAARLWGAPRVVGYDTDPASIVNSWLNCDLNGLSGKLSFLWGEAADLREEDWDLILCNLFLGPILRLIPRLDSALKPGGRVILSGFLTHQADEVGDAARGRHWNLEFQELVDEWVVQEWRKG